MNSKPPTNRNRRRNHALLRWSDLWILAAPLTAAAIWLAAYSITTAIL